MTTASLRLRPVRADDEAVVRAAQPAIAGDDVVFALELDDDDAGWARYVERLAAVQRGDDLPGDRVPAVSCSLTSTESSPDGPRSDTASTTSCVGTPRPCRA